MRLGGVLRMASPGKATARTERHVLHPVDILWQREPAHPLPWVMALVAKDGLLIIKKEVKAAPLG